MKTFVIAEIGVNHNGQLDLALALVEAAAAAGAHAAKFQTFRADLIAAPDTATVAYQRNQSGAQNQHTMLKQLELNEDQHRMVALRCAELGIEFMSTAFDSKSLDLLCDIGIRRIKVPSGEVTNIPYLEDCAIRGLPIILSTGMADMEEVRTAVAILRDGMATDAMSPNFGAPPLTVLHCTSAYPTPLSDVNLLAMLTMSRELDVEIGYSDHTQGIFVAPLAVALGAKVIEKHITLDRTMPGPDHAASIEPHELSAMINAISDAEVVKGDGLKKAQEAELEARALVRRGLKASRVLPAGTVLTLDDVAILRPATGMEPALLPRIIGKQLNRQLTVGEPIKPTDFV